MWPTGGAVVGVCDLQFVQQMCGFGFVQQMAFLYVYVCVIDNVQLYIRFFSFTEPSGLHYCQMSFY